MPHVYVDISLEEFDSEELVEELRSRGYFVQKANEKAGERAVEPEAVDEFIEALRWKSKDEINLLVASMAMQAYCRRLN